MSEEKIPGYEVLEKIGEGGMGEIYRARNLGSQEIVAIKLMPESLWETPAGKGRFLREAILLSTLRHRNICQLVDSGDTESGRFFFATELLQGSTLEQRMIREDFSLDRTLDIAIQIADGLAMAHSVGIIHRDIKPANLILLGDGTVKILDFGLARLEAAEDLRQEGEVMGTATYAAPEQLLGQECDARCDLWALGAVLYEMLTGAVPFRGGNYHAVALSVVHHEPKLLAEHGAEAPPPVQDLVARLLSKIPSDRPGSADELKEELERLRAELAAPLAGSRDDTIVDSLDGTAAEAEIEPGESLVGRLRRLFS